MAFRDVVDELHDKHGLAHTCTAEEADLAALAVGLEQVDHLDSGIEDLGADGELVEFGRGLVDGTQVLAIEFGQTVDGVADDVEQTSFHLFAGGDSDGTVERVDAGSALEAVGTFHSHTADGVLTDVLLNFENEI